MSMPATIIRFSLIILWLVGPNSHADEPWRLRKSDDDMKIYSRPVADSAIKAIKIETRFSAPPEQVAALLLDTKHRQQWDELCTQSQWLDDGLTANGELASTLYLYYDMPWPVSDRDVVMHVRRQSEGNVIRILSQAILSPAFADSGARRIEKAHYEWTLSSIDDNDTAVSAEIFMDPAGPIPAWLLNYLSLTQPGKNIEAIGRMLENSSQP